MLTLAGLVVAHWFGFRAPDIPESVQNSLLNIAMIGVGGYVMGRSAEKVADNWKGPDNEPTQTADHASRPARIIFTFR